MCTTAKSKPREIRKPIIAYKIMEDKNGHIVSAYQQHEVRIGQLTKTTMGAKRFIAGFSDHHKKKTPVWDGAYHFHRSKLTAEIYMRFNDKRIVIECEIPAWSAVMDGEEDTILANRYIPTKVVSRY